MSRKRKILYISGTRADYGLMRGVLVSIKRNPKLEVEIVATGMHLMPEFGKTVNEIKKDGFKVHELRAIYKKDDKESMVSFIGRLISLLVVKIKRIKPDLILVMGDRGEALAGAIVGSYLTIPVAHIHGGDVSSTIDEIARHAITKMSHIHFPATKKSAGRIIKMGEEKRRVFKVGAPGLDDILNEKLISDSELGKKYDLNLSKPFLIVLQHPLTAEISKAANQMKEIREAVKELGYQSIIIYPNADAGGRQITKVIEKYRKYPFVKIHKNIPRKDYLSLLNRARVLVGNSSSGIIEAPSFKLPVVSTDSRQEGRETAGNIINVGCDKGEIKEAVKRAIFDKKFLKKLKKVKNPYGDGMTGKRISNILSKTEINNKLLQKKIAY